MRVGFLIWLAMGWELEVQRMPWLAVETVSVSGKCQ